ncbi:MAG: A/G-specific adenine glycosylase [Actinobacteria bacterium]|nr:A/G-specific adenine glycosylase [Actinomycetota bacterium]
MPRRLTATQRRLLTWADQAGRDLPWRTTRDPWAILVSEVMLQQTQVSRVIPVWTAFLRRFPTPAACATAQQSEVVTAWRGMGYNRRAVNLHRCAIAITEQHGGQLPTSLRELQALPGIGPYTARAVLVFAFEQPVGVVDVNAARVHARLKGHALTNAEVQRRADDATPPTEPWRWNQAVLDLGATVCTKRAPKCGECPLTAECGWRAIGYVAPDPVENSAGIPKRQSTFEGSDRQGRGRLVDALRRGPVSSRPVELAVTMGWSDDADRAIRVAMTVVADGLAQWEQRTETLCLA